MGVLSGRLTRITDRYRKIAMSAPTNCSYEIQIKAEFKVIRSRLTLVRRAISFLTLGITCVSLVVMMLFIGAVVSIDLTKIAAFLFFIVMFLITTSAILFSKEITLGSSQLKRLEILWSEGLDL